MVFELHLPDIADVLSHTPEGTGGMVVEVGQLADLPPGHR